MTTTYQHVMLDLETMSTAPDAAILQIGAIAFNAPTSPADAVSHVFNHATFQAHIDLRSAVASGGIIDPDTVLWWLRQSDDARAAIATQAGEPIEEALSNFADFWASIADPGQRGERAGTMLWSNGADFDAVILGHAYRRAGLRTPWPYWATRCYRTLSSLHPHIERVQPAIKHHALSDATAQAIHLRRIMAAMLRAELATPAATA